MPRTRGSRSADVFGQSLPYATHQSSLNATQAALGSDGRYDFVVSAEDPGVPNWIDTQGHTQGLLFLRWQELSGPLAAADNPTSQVVPVASVRSVLPPDTPTVSPAQRTAQLAQQEPRPGGAPPHLQQRGRETVDRLPAADRRTVGRGPVASIYAGSTLASHLH